MVTTTETIETGSGNHFADLGFEDAPERKLRVQLAVRLNDLIHQRKLNQTKAAALLGISQPHLSELKHYKLSRFPSERLLHFILLFDRDIEIIIRPKAAEHSTGTLSVLSVM